MDSVVLGVMRDERDIERALNLFARAMDNRDWVAMAAILDMIRGFLDSCGPTQHLLGNIIIDVADDTATSKAYIRDVHLNTAGDPSTRFYTLGDYHDTWRRDHDGRWRITERIKANRAYVGPLEIFGS